MNFGVWLDDYYNRNGTLSVVTDVVLRIPLRGKSKCTVLIDYN